MNIIAYTDGASRGNPGQSGIGIILKDEKGNTLSNYFSYIGVATNNIAEYSALLMCIKLAIKRSCSILTVYADSELMVRQMNGIYKVKDSELKKYFTIVNKLLSASNLKFYIHHVTRDKNKEADMLANKGIDTKIVSKDFEEVKKELK